MDYRQALEYVEGYTDYEKLPVPHALGSYDLRRVEDLLSRLGRPQLGISSVHIGGTNGKGSTAAMVASALAVSGYRTGLYSSPHLKTIRERFRVNGLPITEDEFAQTLDKIKPELEVVNQEAKYGEITTFELLTALAFCYFSLKKVDFQVLEVGMGGKYDATNVIIPEVTIITSISLDHMDVLGDSLAEIAREKAGIIKENNTLVLSPQAEEVLLVIEEACLAKQAALLKVGRDITWRDCGYDGNKQNMIVSGSLGVYELSIPLLGKYQLENAATAVAALEVLSARGFHINSDDIRSGVEQVSWAGRLHILGHSPVVIADGAHNPDAARKLKDSLRAFFSYEKSTLIIGVSTDKDVPGLVSELSDACNRVIVTCSNHPRAMKPEELAAEFNGGGVYPERSSSVAEAISIAMSISGHNDIVCVAGSLFVVAEAIEVMETLRG